jgi:hypothetical protein
VQSDALDATKETAKKSPKRVLSRLTGDDVEREAQCWRDADLEHLRTRGIVNGLSAFIGEIEQKLVPIVAAPGTMLPPTWHERVSEDDVF